MTTILLSFILAFFVGAVATWLVMRLAWKLNILDRPDGHRKIHKDPIPRLGGLAVFVAMMIPVIALYFLRDFSTVSERILGQGRLYVLLLGSCMALGLGVIDDVFGLRAKWKFLWQILIGVCMYYLGYSVTGVSNPFGGSLNFGIWALPVTIFWFVACMNAVNLLDGMDGLAAGVSFFVGIVLFSASLQFNNVQGMFLLACFCGSILGFLVFNFPPAKIFLGDSGSLLLGFLIAALSLVGAQRKAHTALALFVPIVALGLPIMDTSLAIVRRWFHHLPVSTPDKEHIHHVLVSMGYTPRRAVLLLYLICVVLGGSALLITVVGRNEVMLITIGGLIITVYICVRLFGRIGIRDIASRLSQDGAMRDQWRRASMDLSRLLSTDAAESTSVAHFWQGCAHVFDELYLASAHLEIFGGKEGEANELLTWKHQDPEQRRGETTVEDDRPDIWTAKLRIEHGATCIGELLIAKHVHGLPMLRQTPEILDRIRLELANQIVKFSNSEQKTKKKD